MSRGSAPLLHPAIARALLDDHPLETVLVDLDGSILYANGAARRALDLTTAADDTYPALAGWAGAASPLRDLLRELASTTNWVPVTLQRDDVRISLRGRAVLLPSSDTPLILLTARSESPDQFGLHAERVRDLNRQLDIQRRTETRLRGALREAEALQRELVHRVKNNLAIIASLLRAKARGSREPAVTEALDDVAMRIRAMAIVHEILDDESETDQVGARQLILRLIREIQATLSPAGVQIVGEIADTTMHISVATPLCLLLNELITNALKHAFVDRPGGQVLVRLTDLDAGYRLTVADNGAGNSQDLGTAKSGGKIARALAAQLQSRLSHSVDGGSVWSLDLPALQPEALWGTDR